MPEAKLLRIYLQDHHAFAVAGQELARRSLRNNPNEGDLTTFLEGLVDEIADDRRALEELMRRMGVAPNLAKQAATWTAEKLGRLKLNGSLVRYSDLSRLYELEALRLGVEGKLALWRSLQQIADGDEGLARTDFDHLVGRAQEQIEGLERRRVAAARRALG